MITNQTLKAANLSLKNEKLHFRWSKKDQKLNAFRLPRSAGSL